LMLKPQMISIVDQLNRQWPIPQSKEWSGDHGDDDLAEPVGTVLVANQQAHSRLLHPFGIDCMELHQSPRHHISPFALHSVDRLSKPVAVMPEAYYYHSAELECSHLIEGNR
jgi:hypothetical protein